MGFGATGPPPRSASAAPTARPPSTSPAPAPAVRFSIPRTPGVATPPPFPCRSGPSLPPARMFGFQFSDLPPPGPGGRIANTGGPDHPLRGFGVAAPDPSNCPFWTRFPFRAHWIPHPASAEALTANRGNLRRIANSSRSRRTPATSGRAGKSLSNRPVRKASPRFSVNW